MLGRLEMHSNKVDELAFGIEISANQPPWRSYRCTLTLQFKDFTVTNGRARHNLVYECECMSITSAALMKNQVSFPLTG